MNYCLKCGSQTIKKEIDGADRFVCSQGDCDFTHWNNPVPVVAALVKHENDYLLARNTAWPENIFSLITGYLEPGESVESAVLREVKEELGLSGKINHFLGCHIFYEKNQLILAFEIVATGLLQTNHELAEIKRLSAAELSTYDFRPLYITAQIIKEWVKSSAGQDCY